MYFIIICQKRDVANYGYCISAWSNYRAAWMTGKNMASFFNKDWTSWIQNHINCNFHDLCYNLGQKPHNDGRFSSHISLSPPYPPFNHFLPPSPHLMLFSTIIAGCLAQQYCDQNNTIEWGVRGQLSYTYIIQCTDNINLGGN